MRAARLATGMRLVDWAQKTGWHHSHLSNVEHGRTKASEELARAYDDAFSPPENPVRLQRLRADAAAADERSGPAASSSPQEAAPRTSAMAGENDLRQVAGSPGGWRRWRVGGAVLAALLAVLVTGVLTFRPGRSAEGPKRKVSSGAQPSVPGDDSRFVADVTVPDGSRMPVAEDFVKTWEIQNVGSAVWENRFLQREGPTDGPGLCWSAPRVPIPRTSPGASVQISVRFRAPRLPGSCYTEWKMVDAEGRYFFPNKVSLYMDIQIVEQGG
jgi:Ig-like domain from next to BRCA1 gene